MHGNQIVVPTAQHQQKQEKKPFGQACDHQIFLAFNRSIVRNA